MTASIDPRLFGGLCVYQDVIVGGETVVEGVRDCRGRWEAIAPHLPRSGSILDVGSNFGWFGLKLCENSPDVVVASVEGDLRSARVQRRVLELNDARRVCLTVARAGVELVGRFARAGQRFDAALCLAVLHWMPDHREFLASLGAITGRIFLEQPDPREEGAGVERIRREIGSIGPYLEGLFPGRPVRRLAQLASHRESCYPRELWIVGQAEGTATDPSAGLDVSTLLANSASWPPRSWWQPQLARCAEEAGPADDGRRQVLFSPAGLQLGAGGSGQERLCQIARRAGRVPENRLLAPGPWCRRVARGIAGTALRRLGVR